MHENLTILQQHVDGAGVVKLTSGLVQIPGCVQLDARERGVAAYIHRLLKTEGIPVELQQAQPGRDNVIATLKGAGGGRSLMLCGHMDTVPPYGMEDPYSGRVVDGILYGRGACDMKGGLAAMLATIIGIQRSGMRLAGNLVLAAVIDEEEMGKGVDFLAEHGPFVDGAVIGEPTDLQIALGHKGLEWLKIEVRGKKVHGGRLEQGVNAVAMAARLLERIYNDYVPRLNARAHPVLGKPTINAGRISGGDQPSTVPDLCTIEFDRRWVPSESLESVYAELNEIIDDLHRLDERFWAQVSGYYPAEAMLPHNPFCTDPADALVRAALLAGPASGLAPASLTAFPAWSDAGILAACTRASCIVFGPGDLALAHTARECVPVEQLKQAARIYAAIALDYCGPLAV